MNLAIIEAYPDLPVNEGRDVNKAHSSCDSFGEICEEVERKYVAPEVVSENLTTCAATNTEQHFEILFRLFPDRDALCAPSILEARTRH